MEWSDACIVNISSRGLLIQSRRTAPAGSIVEIRRASHVIVARVVWREGRRAGLRSDERLPVEEIMSMSKATGLTLVASYGALVERRRFQRPRQSEQRLRGRAIEFIGVVAIAVSLAACVWTAARRSLADPMTRIETALEH